MPSANLSDEQWNAEQVYAIVRQWVRESVPGADVIGVHSATAIRPPGQVRWTSKVHVVYTSTPRDVKRCRELTLEMHAAGGQVNVTCTGEQAVSLCPQCFSVG
ncbi:MAG TPA: hypothetical protein VH593_23275 [Ktedonobacteraceae bacterium]|jgi:hypothetical protein